MTLYILEAPLESLLSTGHQLEKSLASGEWIYFNSKNSNKAEAIYSVAEDSAVIELSLSSEAALSLEPHPDFLDHFLGLFSPSLDAKFTLSQENSFKDFCLKLNSLLVENKKVFDHSRSQKWIWHSGKDLELPPKLHDYLTLI